MGTFSPGVEGSLFASPPIWCYRSGLKVTFYFPCFSFPFISFHFDYIIVLVFKQSMNSTNIYIEIHLYNICS
jgi:hypothetical protein